eukprot:gene9620-biopygen3346
MRPAGHRWDPSFASGDLPAPPVGNRSRAPGGSLVRPKRGRSARAAGRLSGRPDGGEDSVQPPPCHGAELARPLRPRPARRGRPAGRAPGGVAKGEAHHVAHAAPEAEALRREAARPARPPGAAAAAAAVAPFEFLKVGGEGRAAPPPRRRALPVRRRGEVRVCRRGAAAGGAGGSDRNRKGERIGVPEGRRPACVGEGTVMGEVGFVQAVHGNNGLTLAHYTGPRMQCVSAWKLATIVGQTVSWFGSGSCPVQRAVPVEDTRMHRRNGERSANSPPLLGCEDLGTTKAFAMILGAHCRPNAPTRRFSARISAQALSRDCPAHNNDPASRKPALMRMADMAARWPIAMSRHDSSGAGITVADIERLRNAVLPTERIPVASPPNSGSI